MVTWELYSSLHSKVKQEEFTAAEARAEFEVRQVIGPRWIHISPDTFGFDVLQEAICKAMDLEAETRESAAGKGIASISNDGYSETYASTTASAMHEDMQRNIIAWLSGTGLVGAY